MSTALGQVTLSHFRSHHLSRLEPDARPVAVYGANGAGKTNILEAVSLLSPGRGLRRAKAEDLGRKPETLGWKVSATLHTGYDTHEIDLRAEGVASRVVRVDGKPATQVSLSRLARIVWLVPSMDRLWIEGAEGRRRFLDRMTLSFVPNHAEAVLAYEKAMRERNRLLKDQVRDAHWYRAIEAQMANAAVTITANRDETLIRLRAAQDGAETAFPAAELTLVQPGGEDLPSQVEDLETLFSESRGQDLQAGRTLNGPHRADMLGVYTTKSMPAGECSTGEQKALLISLILANARGLQAVSGTTPIVLLDEVAAHLDATRRAALFDEICALGLQAWMTGTGPELFAELGARAQYFEVRETSGCSHVTRTDSP